MEGFTGSPLDPRNGDIERGKANGTGVQLHENVDDCRIGRTRGESQKWQVEVTHPLTKVQDDALGLQLRCQVSPCRTFDPRRPRTRVAWPKQTQRNQPSLEHLLRLVAPEREPPVILRPSSLRNHAVIAETVSIFIDIADIYEEGPVWIVISEGAIRGGESLLPIKEKLGHSLGWGWGAFNRAMPKWRLIPNIENKNSPGWQTINDRLQEIRYVFRPPSLESLKPRKLNLPAVHAG
jgi:hypothetical protein